MALPFDLASLITGYTAPASSAVNPMVLERMQFEQGKRQDAEQNRMRQAYFDQSQQDREYGRDQKVWDTFRDAILSGDLEAIELSKAELERRGFSVEYPGLKDGGGVASVADDRAVTSPVSEPPSDGTVSRETPKSASKDGNIPAWLRSYMADVTGAAPAAPPPDTVDQEQWVPVRGDPEGNEIERGEPAPYEQAMQATKGMDGDNTWVERALGLLPSVQAPATAQEDQFLRETSAPTAPRFSVRDRAGRTVLEADMGRIISARQDRVGEVFDAHLAAAGDEEEKAAAQLAKDAAMKALAAGHTMKEAVALGIQEYNRQVDPLRKAFVGSEIAKARGMYRYGTGGGGGGADGVTSQLTPGQSRLSNEEWDWAIKSGQTQGLNVTSIAKENLLAKAYEASKSPEGLSQVEAKRAFIAALSGATVTDAEAREYGQSVGLAEDAVRYYNRIIESGQQSPEFMRQLQNALARAMTKSLQKRRAAAKTAAQYALSFGAGPESAERVARIWGFGLSDLGLGGGGQERAAPPAKATPKPSAPAGSADERALELLK